MDDMDRYSIHDIVAMDCRCPYCARRIFRIDFKRIEKKYFVIWVCGACNKFFKHTEGVDEEIGKICYKVRQIPVTKELLELYEDYINKHPAMKTMIETEKRREYRW